MVEDITPESLSNSDIVLEDSDGSFGYSKGIGIKEIALNNFNRACLEGSKEMTKGGLQRKIIRGVVMEIDVPNQREMFMNSVKMVEVIVLAKLMTSTLKDKMKEIDDKIGQLKKDYETMIINIKTKQRDIYNQTLGKRQINQDTYKTLYDDYELEIVNLYREKLAIISLLLEENNYFNMYDS